MLLPEINHKRLSICVCAHMCVCKQVCVSESVHACMQAHMSRKGSKGGKRDGENTFSS